MNIICCLISELTNENIYKQDLLDINTKEGEMAKRKKRAVVKKSKESGDILSKSVKSVMPIPQKTRPGWIFINLVLLAGIVYGIFHIIYVDMYEGLSIIVLFLIIILVIKLILKFKQSKKR